MKISGGIVTYNNEDKIEKCLSSIFAAETCGIEITVFDNGSTDDTVKIIKDKFPQVKLLQGEENLGFGQGHNEIIKRVKSDVHFVINPDIELGEDTFATLADYLDSHPMATMVTPRVMNVDETEQKLPKFCPTIRYCYISKFPGFHWLRDRYVESDRDFSTPQEIHFCTGCFFGMRTKDLKELRGFSKKFFMYCEDADLSRRVEEKGGKIIFVPDTYVYHDWKRDNTRSFSGIMRFVKSNVKYFNKWGWKF